MPARHIVTLCGSARIPRKYRDKAEHREEFVLQQIGKLILTIKSRDSSATAKRKDVVLFQEGRSLIDEDLYFEFQMESAEDYYVAVYQYLIEIFKLPANSQGFFCLEISADEKSTIQFITLPNKPPT